MLNPPSSAPQRGVNELGVLWDEHFGNDGLSQTDRMVLIAHDHAADQAEIKRLRGELATRDTEISGLRDSLSDAHHLIDTLQAQLDGQEA